MSHFGCQSYGCGDEAHCVLVNCKDGHTKCLQKGFFWFEARAYDVRDISLPLSRSDVDDLVGHLYRYLRRE